MDLKSAKASLFGRCVVMTTVVFFASCGGGGEPNSPPVLTTTIIEGEAVEISAPDGGRIQLPSKSLMGGWEVGSTSTDAPAEFGDTPSDSIGSAIEIFATNVSGDTVDETPVPMAISLSFLDPADSGLGLIQRGGENFCVLLLTRGGGFFMWQGESLTVSQNMVTFETRRLGIFQLRRCRKPLPQKVTEVKKSETRTSKPPPNDVDSRKPVARDRQGITVRPSENGPPERRLFDDFLDEKRT